MTEEEVYRLAVRQKMLDYSDWIMQLEASPDAHPASWQLLYCQLYGVAPSLRHLLYSGEPTDLAEAVRVVQHWQAQDARTAQEESP